VHPGLLVPRNAPCACIPVCRSRPKDGWSPYSRRIRAPQAHIGADAAHIDAKPVANDLFSRFLQSTKHAAVGLDRWRPSRSTDRRRHLGRSSVVAIGATLSMAGMWRDIQSFAEAARAAGEPDYPLDAFLVDTLPQVLVGIIATVVGAVVRLK
jgi:hypothetical protein